MRLTIDAKHYAAYINSPQWRTRRQRFLEDHGAICRGCGRTDQLHVHHRRYTNLGREPDADLVVLCQTCHEGAHALHHAGHTLEDATTAIIDSTPSQDTRKPTDFTPLNQRPGYSTPHLGGRAGRASGIPTTQSNAS